MGEAKLNRKLNLVLDVDTDNGKVYIHSSPIPRSVFEDNFFVISKTFTAVYGSQLGPVVGPRVAALFLKEEAEKAGTWAKTQQSLMGEIYRLTNVIAMGEHGWETMPWDVAKKRGILDAEDVSEVENFVVYFICASSIHLRGELAVATDLLTQVWGVQLISSNVTEFMRSLPTSTTEESTGENGPIAVNQ